VLFPSAVATHRAPAVADATEVPGAGCSCAMDSLFLPTTQKFYINVLGFGYVMKHPNTDPPTTPSKHVSPLILLDYRCHVEGGAIGTRFHPKLQGCALRLSEPCSWDVAQTDATNHLQTCSASFAGSTTG
jgi:hypothetical protein